MTYIPGFVLFFVNLFIYMIVSDRRPLLKSASTDVIFSNHCLILGYSQMFVITMVFTTLLCLDQAVFSLEVFSIVLSVCHYNGVFFLFLKVIFLFCVFLKHFPIH